ncbi:hypothetical protein RRG08_034299 [Elysia crispata]|uniref:Uncharacterized protein n=1 Tax=Elysia crispata TaxID=231223 RepID=A0AAE1AI08_9GAST|nr:hypothetical protein RRG08_034299 [Elysia crispata]
MSPKFVVESPMRLMCFIYLICQSLRRHSPLLSQIALFALHCARAFPGLLAVDCFNQSGQRRETASSKSLTAHVSTFLFVLFVYRTCLHGKPAQIWPT